MMNKIMLVTGGAGAIGSNLVNRLSADNRVVVLDNLSSGKKTNIRRSPNVAFIKGDICRDPDLKKAFSCKITHVFHLAAHFANQNSIDHPERDLMTNAGGTLKLLEHSVLGKVRKFVYGSTSCVYGNKAAALNENFLDFKHDTPYSISKLTGEKYVAFFKDYYGLDACILRYFNVYGPGEMPGAYRNVIPNFFYKAIKGEPLVITGTGRETRDFTYVDDVIGATIKASESDMTKGMTLNVASGVETRIIDLAEKINGITHNKAGIVFSPKRSWDNISRRCADIEKVKEALGYKVTVGIEEGLKRTYAWLKRRI